MYAIRSYYGMTNKVPIRVQKLCEYSPGAVNKTIIDMMKNKVFVIIKFINYFLPFNICTNLSKYLYENK